MIRRLPGLIFCQFILVMAGSARAEHEGKIEILLLGDSATESSIPRKVAPQEPQSEEVVHILLAAVGDLPPADGEPAADRNAMPPGPASCALQARLTK